VFTAGEPFTVTTKSFGSVNHMANLQSAGMKSLGEHLGIAGADSNKIHRAFSSVEQLKLLSLSEPRRITTAYDDTNTVRIDDLNIKGIVAVTTTHLFDIIRDYQGEQDFPI